MPRSAIKGQTIADFMTKFAITPEMEVIMEPTEPPSPHGTLLWVVHREVDSGTRVVLASSEGHRLNCALRFGLNPKIGKGNANQRTPSQ